MLSCIVFTILPSFHFNFSFNLQIHQNNWNTFPVPVVPSLENNENYPSENEQKQLPGLEGNPKSTLSVITKSGYFILYKGQI